MTHLPTRWLSISAALLALGCGTDSRPLDAALGLDAGSDSGPSLDAATDAGSRDASTDAGSTDAGIDAGASDSGVGDGGTPDAGAPDAGTSDAGTSDAGPPDAGTCDVSPCRAVSPQCGCEAAQRCTLNDSSAFECVPNGTALEGEDCRVDDCARGLVCGESPAFDVCLRFCESDDDCTSGPGSRCLADFGVARACTVGCDPVFGTGCPTGAGCTILQTAPGSGDYFTNCRPAGTVPTGGSCAGSGEEACLSGHSCRSGVCRRWCRTAFDCEVGDTCSADLVIDSQSYGVCIPS